VGNGQNIKIWGDRWLPTPLTGKVQSCPLILDSNSLVASLIDPLSKSWKLDFIQRVFKDEEALVIANIPLSPRLPQDHLIWRGTSNGVFTVRSAYHLGKEIHECLAAQSSRPKPDQIVWKTLWTLTVPNVVKIFEWRACHGVLPTSENLRRRKVLGDASCPCCLCETETPIHAIWSCPTAQDVWGCHLSPFQKCSWVVHSFQELFERSIYNLYTQMRFLMVPLSPLLSTKNAYRWRLHNSLVVLT
jgi:hypothetical protein